MADAAQVNIEEELKKLGHSEYTFNHTSLTDNFNNKFCDAISVETEHFGFVFFVNYTYNSMRHSVKNFGTVVSNAANPMKGSIVRFFSKGFDWDNELDRAWSANIISQFVLKVAHKLSYSVNFRKDRDQDLRGHLYERLCTNEKLKSEQKLECEKGFFIIYDKIDNTLKKLNKCYIFIYDLNDILNVVDIAVDRYTKKRIILRFGTYCAYFGNRIDAERLAPPLDKKIIEKLKGLFPTTSIKTGLKTTTQRNRLDLRLDKEKGELLVDAIKKDNFKVANDLISEGADFNIADETGSTSLVYAVQKGNSKVVDRLILEGADVNAADAQGLTSLAYAIITNKDVVFIRALIKNGADVNIADNKGITPLMHAADNHRPWIVHDLIENGADVNATDAQGLTSLAYAIITNKDVVFIRALIKNGADVNIADNKGITPLMHAADNHRRWIVRDLIENGADVNATDNNKNTALDYANKKGDTAVESISERLDHSQTVDRIEEAINKNKKGGRKTNRRVTRRIASRKYKNKRNRYTSKKIY